MDQKEASEIVKIGDTSGNNAVGLSRDTLSQRKGGIGETRDLEQKRGEGVGRGGGGWRGATALTAVLEVLPSQGGQRLP